jgi:tetratricopeptide (TPR) repeat protein
VVSSEVRKKQEHLMAQANRYYAAERYEDALATWREVIDLDPSSDLAARAKEDIKEVTALIETLERIRSGRGDKERKPQ